MPLPHMTRPWSLVQPYPPPSFALTIPIGAGINWSSVTPPGRNASEVIFYNFGTFSSREVNWYLWHYLGRTKLAPDGANLTFGTDPSNPSVATAPFEKYHHGDPAYIYVPPANWRVPTGDDEALRADVLDALQAPGIAENHFRLTINSVTYSLKSGALTNVREMIRQRRIVIRHDPVAPADGVYVFPNTSPSANTLRLKFARATNVRARALIIHECVHAACDINAIGMPSRIAETMAYIAQAVYLLRNGVSPGSAASDRPLFQAAGLLATRVVSGVRDLTAADLLPLGSLVAGKYPSGVYAFDGL